jgi:hypothetical protein
MSRNSLSLRVDYFLFYFGFSVNLNCIYSFLLFHNISIASEGYSPVSSMSKLVFASNKHKLSIAS